MRTISFVLLAAIAAMACGGNSSIDKKDLATELRKAYCANSVQCGFDADDASCEASVTFQSFFLLTLIADSDTGKATYDGGAAASCADKIRNNSCTFTGTHGDPNSPCNKIFTGTVATGGACFQSNECANNGVCPPTMSNCSQSSACCAGTCAAPPTRGQAGATCKRDGDCVDNLYCGARDMQGVGKCTAFVTTAGATCDEFTACANPMYCNINFAMTPPTGTCKTPAAHGATCDTNDLVACVDDHDFCDPVAKKCSAQLAVGMTCDPAASGPCVGYATCDATSKICVAFKKAGEACTSGGVSCLNDLQCPTAGGTCALSTAAMACH